MKNQTIVAVIISLVVGIGLGYAVWGTQAKAPVATQNGMMHQMPDGSMMSSGGSMDMDSMMKGMMAGLEGKTGDAFDKEFLAEMIVHHQGAVEMAKAVLAKSERPELIKLANDIISAQNKEIGMMQEWQKAWFR